MQRPVLKMHRQITPLHARDKMFVSENNVAACTDTDSSAEGIQFHDDVKKAFGITVSDNLHLNSPHHGNTHRRARKLRAQHILTHGASRLRTHIPQTGVSDPYTAVNYRTQSDNERDCVHDGKIM